MPKILSKTKDKSKRAEEKSKSKRAEEKSKSKRAKKKSTKPKDESGSIAPENQVANTLSVAIYQPHWGNLHHWALNLKGPNYSYIYQVVGEALNFTADVLQDVNPEESGRFTESIQVGTINDADVASFHEIVTQTPVQNDVAEWCCQDYVLEALEHLNEEQIVDDDDYEPAKARLSRRFNH